jgi:hypothetical protein
MFSSHNSRTHNKYTYMNERVHQTNLGELAPGDVSTGDPEPRIRMGESCEEAAFGFLSVCPELSTPCKPTAGVSYYHHTLSFHFQ